MFIVPILLFFVLTGPSTSFILLKNITLWSKEYKAKTVEKKDSLKTRSLTVDSLNRGKITDLNDSLNLIADKADTLNDGGLTLSINPNNEGDYIKSQTVSATYYRGFGWFGDMKKIDPREMYKIKLSVADSLIYQGSPVDPAASPITISRGWNWIGYLPQSAQPISTALISINPSNNDYIKNQTISSTYYDGFGWFGELSVLGPMDGFMLKAYQASALTYAQVGVPLVKLNNDFGATLNINTLKDALAFKDFEYSGQVTASVYLNGVNFAGRDYCLYSLVNGQVRGQSRGMWFDPGQQWIHNHLIYSNLNDGDTVRFRLYDADSDQWYSFEEFVIFRADMLIADALNPFILKSSSLLAPSNLSLEPSLTVWPNPASMQAAIHYVLANDQKVIIQILDFSGRVVEELSFGLQLAGEHTAQWNPMFLEQGVYYLRIKYSRGAYKKVVIAR